MRRVCLLTRVVVVALGLACCAGSAARGADPPRRPPEVWAIVIGIDRYHDDAIPRGQGAVRDSRAIARWFRETAGWDRRHVLELNDLGNLRPGNPATQTAPLLPIRENLSWAMSQWLGPRVQPGDIVVISFAGQAVGKAGREYLLPIDARAVAVENSGWLLDEALDELAVRGQNQILVWLDTSLHGRGRPVPLPQPDEAQADDPPPSGLHWLNMLARWPGVAAWLAADGRPASERPQEGLGPFATALLKGLGTPEQPRSLRSCLGRLHRDGPLSEQGFRALGGIPPELTLWPRAIQPPAELRPELLLQRGHAAGVSAVVLTADGSQMITAGLDSTVRIWRVADRTLLRVLPYHRMGATALALSPDDRWVASGDNFGRVRVWDLVRHREWPLPGPHPHTARIESLTALPDGSRFLSLDRDGKALLWDVADPVLRFQPLTPEPTNLRVACAAEAGGATVAAAAGADGKLRLFAADGQPREILDGPGGLVTALHFSADGRLLAVGDEDGRVEAWEIGPGAPHRIYQARSPAPGEVGALAVSRDKTLAIGVGEALHWVALGRPGAWSALPEIQGRVGPLAFSADGRTLAAAAAEEPGSLHVWRWDGEPARPRPLLLDDEGGGAPTGALSLTLALDGRSLVVGGGDGEIRTWDLPEGGQRPRIPHHRGQVARLGVSADGRFLLQISLDRTAQVWDFQEGRGASPVQGWWNSGAFLRDGDTLVLTADPNILEQPDLPFKGGDVALVDRASGRPFPVTFPRPPGAEAISFGPVAVSADGRKIAAASLEGQGPLVCVWEAPVDRQKRQACRLVHAIRDRDDDDSLTMIGFSADGQHLLTAGFDGVAKVWDLAGGVMEPPLVRDAANGKPAAFRVPAGGTEDPAITAAQIDPADPRRVVTGSRSGRVLLWQRGVDDPVADLGQMDGAIRAVTFSSDGKWLAAAGEDRLMRLWTLDPAPRLIRLAPGDQHVERVNALVAWPDQPLIVSGSDDTTARLWSLAERKLLGIFSAVPSSPERGEPEPAKDPKQEQKPATDWVVYSPSGPFDASHEGERQVRWLIEREVRPLEQYFEQFHVFQLANELRQGQLPQLPEPNAPPAVAIDPPARPVAQDRRIELTVTLSEPGLQDLRLYQNGRPVRALADFRPRPDNPRKLTVPVRLRGGVNRFYAMASRPGAIDGRSQEVEVRFDGPDEPGKLHVVAIGVSRYLRRALRYADADAKSFAALFRRRGIAGEVQPGLQVVLTNDEVSVKKIDRAFATIQAQARPEDTIVVFLAGHTGVVQERVKVGLAEVLQERFHLLLPRFPFPADEPLLVAARGAVVRGEGDDGPGIDRATVLPFVAIYRNLARIDPLQRLVVVDACQAGSILNDPGVRLIQRMMARDSHQARSSYLLAARRGEEAAEAVPLEHGLLTYTLLRGLGAEDIKRVPEVQEIYREAPTADLDADQVVTSLELGRYVDLTLPALAAHFPALANRGEPDRGPPAAHPPPPEDRNQGLRLQAERVAFPLIELPAGP